MKKLLITGLVGLGLVYGANASENRDTTINVYGVSAKIDKNQNSSAGAGVMFDSEAVKVKLEGTSDYIKTGAVLKFNPINNKWYFKVGANYINQKMFAPDSTNARVNQYSGALATGYMLMNDLYVEVGGSYTKLNGSKIGATYEVKDEKTSLAYLEVAKRWESSFGTIDTTANAGRVNHEFVRDENSYGVGVDYYPIDNAKFGYSYQNEKNNIVSVYSAQYGYVFAEYVDNVSTEAYQVNAGVKIAFTDIADFSTYGMPKSIKSHLSELHRFEGVAFGVNMDVQSSGGVSKTAEAVAREKAAADAAAKAAAADAKAAADAAAAQAAANQAANNTPAISTPTISLGAQSVNDNGGGLATNLPAPTVTGVNAGAVYSITTGVAGLTINSSTGVMTYDHNVNTGNESHSITIKVTNTDGGTSSTTFTLNIVDNF